MRPLLAAAASLVVLAGCSGTRATTLWRDPARQAAFKKLLVGVAGTSEAVRRSAEDALVARLPDGAAVASHRVIPPGQERDLERVRAILGAQGFDGALVVRLQGVDQQVVRSSMPTPVTVYGYWGWAHTAVYDQQVLDLRKVVRVESNLFDLSLEAPVWTLETETVDPSSRGQVIDEVADLVASRLGRGGLLGGR